MIKICYFYYAFGEIHSVLFNDISSFTEFISEKKIDVDLNEISTKYAQELEKLVIGDSECVDETIYCCICGGVLYSSFNYHIINEYMSEYVSNQKNVTDGYVCTFLANNWIFEHNGNNGYKINYWFDKEKKEDVYKIRAFKDKIIFEQSDGQIHSVIITNNYYVFFKGKNKI